MIAERFGLKPSPASIQMKPSTSYPGEQDIPNCLKPFPPLFTMYDQPKLDNPLDDLIPGPQLVFVEDYLACPSAWD